MPDVAHVGLPFSYDLFISYSHGDDGQGKGYLAEWSAAFAQELEGELRADPKFRRTLRVFLDRDHRPGRGVDPMAPLTEQLQRQISTSAVLVVLMSPDYLSSRWCADERDWWFKSQAAHGVPADERVAVVRIWPTEDPWPAVLRDSRGEPLPGFPFHAESDGPPRPLGWAELPGPFGTDFRKAVLGIAGRLYPKLDAMQTRLAEIERAKTDATKLTQEGGQSLYLHGRADRAESWERAALQLTESGFAVVPGEPDPVEPDVKKLQAIRERRVEALSDCDALLLVATDDTRALDNDLVVVGKHDRQSARARSNHLLPCGVLNTVGNALTTKVRIATARIVQADWIDGTSGAWTPAVRQWLNEKGQLEP
jgi:TIR domain